MKKATLIIIFAIYLGSIALISFLGMKAKVYEEIIPVTKIECVNETDSTTTVTEKNGVKTIKIKFDEPGNVDTLTGTMVQLLWKVSPDNATYKNVQFIYNEDLKNVTFVKDSDGNELGLMIFTGKCYVNLQIVAVDGSRVKTNVVVWAY